MLSVFTIEEELNLFIHTEDEVNRIWKGGQEATWMTFLILVKTTQVKWDEKV